MLEFGSPGRQVEGRAGVGSGAKMHISGSQSCHLASPSLKSRHSVIRAVLSRAAEKCPTCSVGCDGKSWCRGLDRQGTAVR